MARSEARLCVDIWSDEDFLDCSAAAQRMFMFLISQPDLAHDGVIALRERRWAGKARGLGPDEVRAALTELEHRRFVVVDESTEELLVRSFIRRDKVFKQPNVLRAAADHLRLVASPRIRFVLAVELARISQERMPEPSTAIIAEMRRALPDPTDNPSPNPSAKDAPGTPGERGVVTDVSTGFPVPLSPVPLAPSPKNQPLASLARPNDPDDFAVFWSIYPRREAKAAARKAWDKAIKRADPGRIVAGATRYRDDPARDPQFTAHPASWLNADRWDDEPLPRGSPNGRASPPSTTDARVSAALALADQIGRQGIGQ